MHSIYAVKFDSKKMIDHFGGALGASKALEAIGIPVKVKTLQKQRERGNIPADMVASLMLASKRIDHPMDPFDFLLERTDDS